MEPIAHVLHASRVRALVDGKTFARGEAYHREGRVGELARSGATVSARVSGSSWYEVRLWVKSGRIAYSCSCPVGAEGAFCKHCVAVALAVLAATSQPVDVVTQSDDEVKSDDTEQTGYRLVLIGAAIGDALRDFDDLTIVTSWDADAADGADVVAIDASGGGAALLALGLFAATGKVIACCDASAPHAAVVDAVCRRHGIHLTPHAAEHATAVRARLRSVGLV